MIYRHTGSAVGAAAFFICAQVLPALAGPPLIALFDQLPPRRMLMWLYTLEAAISLALAWTVAHFSLAVVLVLALLDGMIAVTTAAIVYAVSVSVTSPAGLLREGNALLNAAFSVCFMVAPAIGGLIVAAAGASVPLLINAGLFAAVVVTLLSARTLPEPASDHVRGPRLLRSALSYAASDRAIRRLLTLQAVSLVFFTISLPVEIVFTVRSLHSGAGGYGALIAAWGAGALVGSAIYARFRRLPMRALMCAGAVALGGGFMVMAVAPVLIVAVLGSAIAGIGNGIYAVAVRTALQEEVRERFMALAMSLNEAINRIMPGVGILLGGACTALFGPRPALALAGGGSLLVATMTWALLPPAAPEPARSQQPAEQLHAEPAEL